MSELPLSDPAYRRDLGDGLVLRWATTDDTAHVGGLYQHVYRGSPSEPLNTRMIETTDDCMSGRHPLVSARDFAVVEDTRQGGIVAVTCLMQNTWEFDGLRFGVGRPEFVATHHEYRNRGLIRAIFALIHARSEGRGDMAQGITGIEYYYRQFGYEYALELGGHRALDLDSIPALKEGQSDEFALRPATPEDLPLVFRIYEGARNARGHLVSAPLDEPFLRWIYDGIAPERNVGLHTYMVERAGGELVGYVWAQRARWSNRFNVVGIELLPEASLYAVLPSVLRGLKALALAAPAAKPDTPPASRLGFELGGQHRLYDALGPERLPYVEKPYGWYVRVPDLPAFVRFAAPTLERRLATSVFAGHTGEAKLNFYRGGLRLAFENGKLAAAELWRAPLWGKEWGEGAHAGFPPLTFLQLLFGHRSLDELKACLPDVWANDEGRALLGALFPKQASFVLPQD